MSPHVDILDQSERLAPSLFGSLAFHGLFVLLVVAPGRMIATNFNRHCGKIKIDFQP